MRLVISKPFFSFSLFLFLMKYLISHLFVFYLSMRSYDLGAFSKTGIFLLLTILSKINNHSI